MLTLRKGTGGATSAEAMVSYAEEGVSPDFTCSLAGNAAPQADQPARAVAYYLDAAYGAGAPWHDMPQAVAEALAVDPTRQLTHNEAVNLLKGLRADGEQIEGKRYQKVAEGKDRITFYDFTLSAGKSVSIAYALAPTDAERRIILDCHVQASEEAMRYLQGIVGLVRKGDGGSKGTVEGEIAWFSYTHTSARPVAELAVKEEDGSQATIVQSVNTRGDMLLHTHKLTPNFVLGHDGSVGSLHSAAIHERVHEVGAVYEARLSTLLRKAGVETDLDREKASVSLSAVPEYICDHFSKRTKNSEEAARKHVAEQGLDWNSLSPEETRKALKREAKRGRQAKEGGERDEIAEWKAEAREAGYEHRSVIDQDAKTTPPLPEPERLRAAFEIMLELLEEEFRTRAVLPVAMVRTMGARALVATGTADLKGDIDKLEVAAREHGVLHDGTRTALITAVTADEEGRETVRITTVRSVQLEREMMALARRAAQDKTATLSPEVLDRAIQRVSDREGLDFTSEHGREQVRIIHALGAAGKLGVAIGVGGAGKTSLLMPIVDALHEEGREVYGAALAWRQSDPLADAGVHPGNSMAAAAFLARAEAGKLKLSPDTVVIVDELSQIGTQQGLALLRLREQHDFTLYALGDPLQNQAIEAGNSIALFRMALGEEVIPEISSSVRQLQDRDKETALLFRQGFAEAGLERMREDGHVILAPGGRTHAIEAVANLWAGRASALAGRENAVLTVSAPTNQDARDISAAIREKRRSGSQGNTDLPQLGPDLVTLAATDQNGAKYELPLAVGDRVRLFDRVTLRGAKGGVLGNNGSVLTVEAINEDGLTLRNAKGRESFVPYDAIRNENSGRVRLSYGDVVTLDAIQSATSTEHVHAMVSGSAAVNSFKNYVGLSRARENSWIVGSKAAEHNEVLTRRALGNVEPVTDEQVWANIARNLARQPKKELAAQLLERANGVTFGQVRSMAPAFQPAQQAAVDAAEEKARPRLSQLAAPGAPPHRRQAGAQPRRGSTPEQPSPSQDQGSARRGQPSPRQRADTREVPSGRTAVPQRREAASQARGRSGRSQTDAARHASQALKGASSDLQVKHERRSMRVLAARPKAADQTPRVTTLDAEASFREALSAAGLRFGPRDRLQMDGKRHYLDVDGSKSRRGFYVVYLDGATPRGVIINHKIGVRVDWKPDGDGPRMNGADIRAERERIEAAREQREADEARDQERAARRAEVRWNSAQPATPEHPYLRRKGIETHGLREDRRGNLLVPMRDADGKLWGLQSIAADGSKLYQAGAKRKGTHAILGELKGSTALVIAEGLATAATVREATGLPVAVAFHSGNLAHVARAHRQRDPERRIVLAADNDHHLPGVELRQQASAEGRINVTWPNGATGKTDRGNTIEYRMQGVPDWTLAVRGWHNPELDIGNLVPGTRYEVRVFNSRHPRPLANNGIAKASAAAKEVDGVVVAPAFALGDPGTDWNDVTASLGKIKVGEMLRAELRGRGIEASSQASRDAARARASTGEASAASETARRAQMRPHGPRL